MNISQWLFTKLGMCFDIVEICLGLLIGKFCQFLTELSAHHISIFTVLDVNIDGFSQKLGMCIDIVKI